MSDEHRTKIANSSILKCLIDHAQGRRKMSATQVTAGLGLLKKVLPDLTAMEFSGEVHNTYALSDEMPTAEQWEAENATAH